MRDWAPADYEYNYQEFLPVASDWCELIVTAGRPSLPALSAPAIRWNSLASQTTRVTDLATIAVYTVSIIGHNVLSETESSRQPNELNRPKMVAVN